MADFGVYIAYLANHLDGIEAEVVRFLSEPIHVADRGPGKRMPLGPVHRGDGPSEFLAASGLDLYENQDAFPARHDIQFIAPTDAVETSSEFVAEPDQEYGLLISVSYVSRLCAQHQTRPQR